MASRKRKARSCGPPPESAGTSFIGTTQAVSTIHTGAEVRAARAPVQRGRGGAGKSSLTTSAARRATAGRCLSPEQVERFAVGDYAHVRGLHVTTPDAVEVIAPLPGVTGSGGAGSSAAGSGGTESGDAGAGGGPGLERMLTLTTCHPLYSNAERLIVHAVLTDTTSKSAGLPDALEE